MGYVVECINTTKSLGVPARTQSDQRALAERHGAWLQYFTHEIEGRRRTVTRNDTVHVALFDDVSLSDLLRYISGVSARRVYRLDCLYRDDVAQGLLYASHRYLKRLDANTAKDVRARLSQDAEMVARIRRAAYASAKRGSAPLLPVAAESFHCGIDTDRERCPANPAPPGNPVVLS